MKITNLLLVQLFLAVFLYSQDTLTIVQKAEIYYSDLKYRYGVESANYNLEYNEKFGDFPPIPHPIKRSPFFHDFYRRECDSLLNIFYQKSNCIESGVEYIEERLLIWELMKGGRIPDSTFIDLMDAYYELVPDRAINFCVSRWNFKKIHVLDLQEYNKTSHIKNYPYVVFLFDNLSLPDLLNTLFKTNSLSDKSNEDFVDLCIKEMRYIRTDKEMLLLIEYIGSLQNIVDPKEKVNDYLIKKIIDNEK